MALATRCPHCQTVFRIVPDQLKLHRGLVRCGHCREVFDGVLHQVEPPIRPVNPVAPAQPSAPAAQFAPSSVPPGLPDAPAHADGQSAGQAHDAWGETSEPAPEVFPEAHDTPGNEAREAAAHEAPDQTHGAAAGMHDALAGDAIHEAAGLPGHEAETSSVGDAGEVFPEAHGAPSSAIADEPHSFATEHAPEPVHEVERAGFGNDVPAPADATLEHELRTEVADATEDDFVAHAAQAAEHDARLASHAPPFVAQDPDAQHGPVEEAVVGASGESAGTDHESPRHVSHEDPLDEPVRETFAEARDRHDAARKQALERTTGTNEGVDTAESFTHHSRPSFGHEEAVIDVEPTTPHYGPTVETDPWIAPADARAEPALSFAMPTVAAAAAAGPAFAPLSDDDRNDFRIRVEPHPEAHDLQQHPARRIAGWIVAALLLLLLLALLAWWQREPVMARWPQTADIYRQACVKLGCVVLPPRNIDQLQIETSTLSQSTQPNQFELSMSVHNRAALALAWPSIEISLLDANNQLVIRRVIGPAQYLPAGTDFDAGIGANGRQAVRLQLSANGATPANYRVLIFYP
jgi:predicted Zn finger-like uncharacterized protein